MKVAVPLAKNVLAPLATIAPTSATYGAIQRKMGERGVVKAGKGVNLVISNEDLDAIIRIIKSIFTIGEICWLEKETLEQEENTIIWIIWIQYFNSAPSFKQYWDYYVFDLWI